MPYLPVELDALNLFTHVAAAGGVERPIVTDGMCFMWAYCFRADTDRITRVHVKGFFGVDLTDALLAFGFLEPTEAAFRVKGAEEKLLAQRRARRAGGHAAKGNLKRGPQRASSRGGQPEPSRESAGEQPGNFPGSTPALTPNTQHPTPNTKEAAAAADPVSAMGGVSVPPAAIRELADRRRPPKGPLIFDRPEAPPDEWLGPDFERWFQWLRQSGGLPAELRRPDPRELGDWFNACLMTPGVTVTVLKRAAQAYGKDPYWEAEGFPFRGFMKQWDMFVAKEKARATAGRS